MSKFLQKIPLRVLLLLLGAVEVGLAFYRVEDIKSFKIDLLAHPLYPLFAVGLLLILASLSGAVASAYTNGLFDFLPRTKITTSASGVTARICDARLSVELDRIEDCALEPSNTLIVLPANEFFDDACINDRRSSLGAFMLSHFPTGVPAIQLLVAQQLQGRTSTAVYREPRLQLNSFGVGTTVYLDQPLGTPLRLLLAAVTTHRSGEGLKADPATLFRVAQTAYSVARDHRLAVVCSPVMGAGHGSLSPDLALFSLLLAWSDILYRHPGDKLVVRVVVFRSDPPASPEIPVKRIRRLLRLAAAMCRPHD